MASALECIKSLLRQKTPCDRASMDDRLVELSRAMDVRDVDGVVAMALALGHTLDTTTGGDDDEGHEQSPETKRAIARARRRARNAHVIRVHLAQNELLLRFIRENDEWECHVERWCRCGDTAEASILRTTTILVAHDRSLGAIECDHLRKRYARLVMANGSVRARALVMNEMPLNTLPSIAVDPGKRIAELVVKGHRAGWSSILRAMEDTRRLRSSQPMVGVFEALRVCAKRDDYDTAKALLDSHCAFVHSRSDEHAYRTYFLTRRWLERRFPGHHKGAPSEDIADFCFLGTR
jgi:hypothetical protein